MRATRLLAGILATSLILASIGFTQTMRCFRVQAKTTWQNSGFQVTQGDNLLIFAKGVWAYADSTYFGDYVGPEGQAYSLNGSYLVPNANQFALVAKIGVNGTPVGIGQFYQFTPAPASGTIYFAMNEQIGNDGDNAGSIIVAAWKNGAPIAPVSVSARTEAIPDGFELSPNYPNPFNPSTAIEYSLPGRGSVEVEVFDVQGQRVRTLESAVQEAGLHRVVWDGRNDGGMSVASGTYFYQVKVDEAVRTRHMLLLK